MNNQTHQRQFFGNIRDLGNKLLLAARNAGDRKREVLARIDLGIAALRDGDVQRGIADFEEALALARDLGFQSLENDAKANLGVALLASGQPIRARELLEEQVVQARSSGDPFAEKLVLDHLGAVHVTLRDQGLALEVYAQALALAREVGDRQHQADLLWIIAIQHAEQGQRERAIAVGREAIGIYEQTGSPHVAGFEGQLLQYSQNESNIRMLDTWEASSGPRPGGYYTGATFGSDEGNLRGPALLWMALAAARSAATFFGSGLRTVERDIFEDRLRVCGECPHHTGVRCKVCGCFTTLKAWLPHEHCPLGKWSR